MRRKLVKTRKVDIFMSYSNVARKNKEEIRMIQVDGYDAEEFLVLISEVATMNLFNLWFNNATCMRQE